MKLALYVITLIPLSVGIATAQEPADQLVELNLDAEVIESLFSDGGHIIAFYRRAVGSAGQSSGTIGGFGFTTPNTDRGLEVRYDDTYQGLVIPPEGLRVDMPYSGTRATVNVYLPNNPPVVEATVFDVDGNAVQTLEMYWNQGLGVFDFYADDPILAAIELTVSGPGASVPSAAITP